LNHFTINMLIILINYFNFIRYILDNGFDDHYRNIQIPFKKLNFLCDTWYLSESLSINQNKVIDKGKTNF
jgi:hypothetical protein